MANLPSTFVKVNDVELRQDTIVAESQYAKLGSNDNYLKDNLDAEITNRTNGDAANTTLYNNIKTEVNAELFDIPCLVYETTLGPFYVRNDYPSYSGPTPIDLTNVYSHVYINAYRFDSPSADTTTYVRVVIWWGNLPVRRVASQQSISIPAITRSDWDFASFYLVNINQIRCRFYKIKTVTIP